MTATTSQPTAGQPPTPAAPSEAKPISRRWAALAFAASSLTTAALTVGGGWLSHHYEQQQDKRQEDNKAFREVADKLDQLFRDFMALYLATSPVDGDGQGRVAKAVDDPALLKSVEAIQSNILQQDAILERLQMVMGGRDADTIRNYRDRLIDLSSSLDHLPPVEDSDPVLQKLEAARKTRLGVLEALQARADALIYRPRPTPTIAEGTS